MVRQTSRWSQIFILSLVGLGATAFATAWFYRIDEVITVQGRLVPQRGGVEVKSPVSGQLDKLLVKGGDQVDEGDVLLRFDVRAAQAQEATLREQLTLEEIRLKSQLESNSQRQQSVLRNIALTEKILSRLQLLKRMGDKRDTILQQSST